MSRVKLQRDPRGHSLRIYSEVFDSPAFRALSAHDVMAYLALLRELKGYNNGDLSLPLSRAKRCGINHHMTLARSLRALCAVGLVSLSRKGGCTKGGQRLASLYRLTDRECFEIPAKYLTAKKETNEWRRITSVEMAKGLIEAAEMAVKKGDEKLKPLGHGVTATTSPHDVIGALTTLPREVWNDQPGHGVTMVKKGSNPMPMRAGAAFRDAAKNPTHRTPHVSPLYIATPTLKLSSLETHGSYQRLHVKPAHLFTNLFN